MLYKFSHIESYTIQTPFIGREELSTEFLEFTKDGKITIKGTPERPFKWDGCTPKLFKFTWLGKEHFPGTWDGKIIKHPDGLIAEQLYYASMVHDAIYFLKDQIDISRLECDDLFLQMMREVDFRYTPEYYWAVCRFGGRYGEWKRTASYSKLAV